MHLCLRQLQGNRRNEATSMLIEDRVVKIRIEVYFVQAAQIKDVCIDVIEWPRRSDLCS